jgi:hypothetical protein
MKVPLYFRNGRIEVVDITIPEERPVFYWDEPLPPKVSYLPNYKIYRNKPITTCLTYGSEIDWAAEFPMKKRMIFQLEIVKHPAEPYREFYLYRQVSE